MWKIDTTKDAKMLDLNCFFAPFLFRWKIIILVLYSCKEALNYKLEWQPLCIYQLPFDFFSSLTKVLLLWKSKLQEIAIWCQIGGKNNKKLVCPMIGGEGGLQEQGLGSLIIFQLTLNKTMTFKQPIKKYCNAFLLL